jgi:hypothetical protein
MEGGCFYVAGVAQKKVPAWGTIILEIDRPASLLHSSTFLSYRSEAGIPFS